MNPTRRSHPRRRSAAPFVSIALLAGAAAACNPSAHAPTPRAETRSAAAATDASSVRYFGDEYARQLRALPADSDAEVASF